MWLNTSQARKHMTYKAPAGLVSGFESVLYMPQGLGPKNVVLRMIFLTIKSYKGHVTTAELEQLVAWPIFPFMKHLLFTYKMSHHHDLTNICADLVLILIEII